MNFFLALLAAICYALQVVFVTIIARRNDPLLTQSLRGLSFGITMLPVLFLGIYLGDYHSFKLLFVENIWLLVLAIIFAGCANWCITVSNVLLPVAFGSTIGNSLTTIIIGIIGVFYFSDPINLNQVLIIVTLILVNILFYLQKDTPDTQYTYSPLRGYLCAVGFAFFIAHAFSIVAKLSRTTHPFVVAYCWEFGIGIFLTILIYVRNKCYKKQGKVFCKTTFKKIALYSSPTVIGTASYAYALKLGPLPLVAAVQGSVLIFIALFSSFIFHEKLSMRRWGLIVVVFLLLALLKLFV